jgi:hypothetical protein
LDSEYKAALRVRQLIPHAILVSRPIAGIVTAMFRCARILGLMLLAGTAAWGRHSHHPPPAPPPPVFQVGGLQFTLPVGWLIEPSLTPARAAQWLVPPPAAANAAAGSIGPAADGVQVVVFFFGPGIGGSAQENIAAWAGTIATPDGKPATATPQTRTIAGHKSTEVLFSGTYSQVNPQPGLPPTSKPGYALLGAVVENPGGTIYWRVTGPVAQLTAFQPVFDQMLGSLKPAPAP